LPEVGALRGLGQGPFHHLDAYDHTHEVLARQVELEGRLAELFGPEVAGGLEAVLAELLADGLTRGEALRLAALLHDVGKATTRAVMPNGRVGFPGHDVVGQEMIAALARRLRLSERLRSFLIAVTAHHLDLGFLVRHRPLGRAAVYRYLAACQPVEVEVTLFTCADRLATRGRNAEPSIAAHLELAREMLEPALEWRFNGQPAAPVRGDDLARALDISPGPELGPLLARLAEARYTGEAETPEDAVALARRLRQNRAP
jgi:putative nucleotidyltransferase with HDIG domain